MDDTDHEHALAVVHLTGSAQVKVDSPCTTFFRSSADFFADWDACSAEALLRLFQICSSECLNESPPPDFIARAALLRARAGLAGGAITIRSR